MTRRMLMIGACVLPAKATRKTERVPLDLDQLNSFATLYNTYVAELTSGKVALKTWERVERCWERMVT